MRLISFFGVALTASLLLSCGGTDERVFIDEEPIEGSHHASWDFPGDGSLKDIVRTVDFVGVFTIDEIVSVDSIEEGRTTLLYTTYRATPTHWIRGESGESILITQFGGIDEETHSPQFTDGSFLLTEGNSYLLSMTSKPERVPGPGTYWPYGGGRGAFQVTDGVVHVLNHPIADGLTEEFGGMPLDAFISAVSQFAAMRRLVEEPSSSQDGIETDSLGTDPGSPGVSSILPAIEYAGIDTNVDTNSATFLGQRDPCQSAASTPLRSGVSTGDNDEASLVDDSGIFDEGLVGAGVQLVGGTGSGQSRLIVGVSGSALEVAPAWSTIPDNTSEYLIRPTVAMDVVASGIPPFESSTYTNGLQSLGLLFEFDPNVLTVLAVNPNGYSDTLLAASGSRIAFDIIDGDALYGANNDPLPSTAGLMRIDLSDLSENFESGSGVLARLLIQPVGSGTSQMFITPELNDASGLRYDVGTIYSATLNVDSPCA